MIVVDANVLLYAYNDDAQQHPAAKAYLQRVFSGDVVVGIPWFVVVAFLRISTNRHAYPNPLIMSEACEIVAGWFRRKNVIPIAPGGHHFDVFRETLLDGQVSGDLVSDAHIAAMALENGATLATTDRDFARFERLRRVNPLDP